MDKMPGVHIFATFKTAAADRVSNAPLIEDPKYFGVA
jgi:hypothetical protein